MPEFLADSQNSTSPVAGRREVRERLGKGFGWFYDVGQTLQAEQTDFQAIEVVKTKAFGTGLLLDGATQLLESHEFQYHEPMAHLALLSHADPQRVLVIGGGDGGVLREVLKHRSVKTIDFVELDEKVVAFSRRYLPTLGGAAFDDQRVRLHFMDGRAFVEAATARSYDVIIMDMIDPLGPSLRLYTAEFFQAVRRILRDDKSFFVMHSESPEGRPEAFTRIRQTLASVFPLVRGAYAYVLMYGCLWSFALCSVAADAAATTAAVIDQRISQRGVGQLRLVSSTSWPALFACYPYIEELLKRELPLVTDAAPEFPDSFDPRH